MLESIKKVKLLMRLYKKDPNTELNTKVDFSDHSGPSAIEKSLEKLGFHLDRRSLKRRDVWLDFVGPAGVWIKVDHESGFGFVDLNPNNQAVPRPPKEFTVTLRSEDRSLTSEEVIFLLRRAILPCSTSLSKAAQKKLSELIIAID